MNEMDKPLFTFPKLNAANYTTWKVDMKVLLIDRGSWEFVSGDAVPLEEDVPQREKRAYQWRKEKAYTTIYQGIERQFLPLIADTTDGKTAWDILKKNFEPVSRARLARLIDEFYELKFHPESETIGIFCRRVQEKKHLIKEAGFEMPECLVCFQLIRKLPADYDNLVQLLYRLEDKQFQSDYLESQLINEAGRIQQKKLDEGSEIIANAYETRIPSISNFRNQHGKPIPVQSSGPVLDPTERKFGKKQNAKIICHYCTKEGHKIYQCFARKQDQQKSSNERRYASSSNKAFYSEVSKYEFNSTFQVKQDINENAKPDEWLIDSAATSHFCNRKDWFENFKTLPPTEALIGDKNCMSKVLGVGDINFLVKDYNKLVEIKLLNVLYAPNMRRNLIGGANMDIAGFKIIWENNKMKIYRENGEYFFSVPRIGKLYILKGFHLKKPNEAYLVNKNSRNVDIEILHRRFNHLNAQTLEYMSRQNSVKGIENLTGNLDCLICKTAKLNRASLRPLSESNSKHILDRVYMDVWGPSPVKSLGGNRYFLSIIDDYTRKVVVYILKQKSEVFDCFKKYLAMVERDRNIKLKCVRTDNGMEFCHKEFESFLSDHGIRIERTSVYTPEQNGIAERFNRTAMDGVRSMLQDSGLPQNFWAEALLSFVHTFNRSTHKPTQDKTPTEIWTGRKPLVTHLKIFGSLAFIYVPKLKRNKLEPKAKVGILVGYALKTKGYRIWLPEEKQIIETVHVNIDETKNGLSEIFRKKQNYQKFKLDNSIDYFPEEFNDELEDIDIKSWTRVEKPRTKSSRIDIFYYPPVGKPRLRSQNDVKKYCKEQNLVYDPTQFLFKPLPTKTIEPENSDSETSEEISVEECQYVEHLNNIFQESEVDIPKSFSDVENLPNKGKWYDAMRDEIKIMEERNVWKLVEKPPKTKVLGNRWVYSIKRDDKGNIVRHKARLVAQGFAQKYGTDYNEVFSPVVNFSIIKFLFILLVSLKGWNYTQLDVKSAYLYGKLTEKIYMKQPMEFADKDNEYKVCLLQKAIYGLHQSGREWSIELDSILKTLNFQNLKWCNCVYKLNNEIILLVYVDDIVIFGKNNFVIENAIVLLKSKIDVKTLGKVKFLLGVNFDCIDNSVYLHQETYISKLANRFVDLPRTHVNIPLKLGLVPDKNGNFEETELMRKYPYKSLIGCLLFLSNRSRPDISFAVNTMSQYCNCYTYNHWLMVVDIFNYVLNTRRYKINLSKINNGNLIAYTDANWGCNWTNRHSTSGYILSYGNVPFSWRSSKQKCIALSTMESEFIALTESVKEIIWFYNVSKELNFDEIEKPIVYCDNKSAIYFCVNNVENIKTKHIDIKYKFIRQLLLEGKFILKYVSSKVNLADFLTKPLPKERLQPLIGKIFSDTTQTTVGPNVG